MSLVPFALWPAFPASDYYGTSATPISHQATLTLPFLLTQAVGDCPTLPTFTMFPLVVGVVPNSTPAASLRAKRSPTRSLDEPTPKEPTELEPLKQRRSMRCSGPYQPDLSRLKIKECLPLVHLRYTVLPR